MEALCVFVRGEIPVRGMEGVCVRIISDHFKAGAFTGAPV